MELMEVIKSSVSIFSVFTVALVILSYIIFKVKDKTRVKPYERLAGQDALLQEQNRLEKIRREQMNMERARQAGLRQENQILMQPVQRREAAPIIENRYKIINTPNINNGPINQPVNIFDLYSRNINEPMHKMKLSAFK